MLDFIRIACAVPAVKVGDVKKNAQGICTYMRKADAQNVDLVVFPELSLTGYTCGDLFFQDSLWEGVKAGLREILSCSKSCVDLTAVVGLPVRLGDKLLNCAAVLRGGNLLGLIPKTYIPNYKEFSEKRWFSTGLDLTQTEMSFDGEELGSVPLGTDLLIPLGEGAVLGVEICEDLLAPIPPSSMLALRGANVIVNLSASNETVGKHSFREEMVKYQSGACGCIYAYCSAGYTESTSDLVFSGHSLIAENGNVLTQNENLLETDYLLVSDCDFGRIQAGRRENNTFQDAAQYYGSGEYFIAPALTQRALRSDGSLYPVKKFPFVPECEKQRNQRCREVFEIQVTGLKQRLAAIGSNAVIGISGGLDSTLALLVAVEAMRRLGRPLTDVYGITMPCFGTSDRTYQNAWELMRILGISSKEISIREAVSQHFQDIGHDRDVHNGTYENAQARERTQVLMDYASVVGGIVVGTGDLSELALGWCTYNGDHMSMYGVNCDVPKTLIPWVIKAVADRPEFAAAKTVLQDILDTPISPELLPPDAQGNISQQTEDLVGPYALHDFFLYHSVRFGFKPTKIYALACRAFAGEFDEETIKKWLKNFYRRFFTQQFKRNCAPDGVRIGSVALGPRGDWKMGSDISANLWLEEIDTL